jgi:organic hydroperoxide reductase OsmC/OhrA
MLSYFHACVLRGVVVTSYVDEAIAEIEVVGNGGSFTGATLRPRIEVAEESMIDDALAAHEEAHEWCFISNSLNFEVVIEPTVTCARAGERA